MRDAEINTYAEMWLASGAFMDNATSTEAGSYFQIMGGLVFTAFTLEAYLNHVGQHLFRCWEKLERLQPHEKLSLICEKLEIDKNDKKPPFQRVRELMKFRNEIAHGKTVQLKEESIYVTDPRSRIDDRLQTQWQRYCKLDILKNVREDIEKIILEIHKESGMRSIIFNLGLWERVSSVLDEGAA